MRDLGSIPRLGRSPGEGNGHPLQCSGLENSMDCISPLSHKDSDTRERLSLSFQHTPMIITLTMLYVISLSSVAQSCPTLCDPWTAAHQASLSFTIPQSLLKFMTIESVMPFNHLILCCSLLLLPSIFPSIKVFSNESALHIRWPQYWSFNFSISPSNEY